MNRFVVIAGAWILGAGGVWGQTNSGVVVPSPANVPAQTNASSSSGTTAAATNSDITYYPNVQGNNAAGQTNAAPVAESGTGTATVPAKAGIAVSLLNLHANLQTADSGDLEKKLTAALESKLAALPGFVLLKQVRGAAAPLQTATYLIDGEMNPPMSAGGEVSVHLNIRPAEGKASSVEVSGPATDLDALAGKMAAGIQKAVGALPTPAPWPAAQEAREFLKEGIWGYQHNQEDAALEALDSAELLGETAPDLLAVRIPILCRRIVGTSGAYIYYNGEPVADDPAPEAKIVALKRAMEDQAAYEKAHGEDHLQFLDHMRSMDGRTWELHKAIDREGGFLLVMLDRTKQPQAADVRTALRAFMNYDPQQGKLPGDWEEAIDFADHLAASKDEELAYYRGIVTKEPFADFGARRLMWQLQPDAFCAPFIAEADRPAAYTAFFKELAHDPVGAPLALFLLASRAAPADKDAACHALYQCLWDSREQKTSEPKRLSFNLESAWKLEQQEHHAKVADPLLVQLLHYYLQHDDTFTGLEMQAWIPELFPASEAPGLLADLKAYEKRDPKLDEHQYYARMEQAYYDHFGGDPNAGPVLPSMPVTRFWYPKDAPRRLILGMGAITPVPDGVWLAGELDGDGAGTPETGMLYHVGLNAAKPGWFIDPAAPVVALHPYMHDLVLMPEGLYTISSTSDQPPKTVIDHYDPKTKLWNEGEVPGADQLYAVAGQLYFNLKGLDFQHREGGIARYDGKTGNGALLASSRRRPAQNQLDDCADYRVDDIFAGPGGKPCVAANWKFYVMKDTPGQWDLLLPDSLPFGMRSKTQGALTLISGYALHTNPPGQTVIVIDSSKPEPEVWLGPLTQVPLQPGADPAKRAPLPAWAAKSFWQQPKGGIQASDYGVHGEDLFAFVAGGVKSTKLELVWFQRGKAEPVHIPLAFKMSDDTKAALAVVIPAGGNTRDMVTDPNKTPYVLNMTVLPQGICFKSLFQGFWFIPFSDIEAYLKKNGGAGNAPAHRPPKTADKPVVAPKAESPQRDTIDVGNPTSFE